MTAGVPVVVDTNILFSAIISAAGRIAETLFLSHRRFVISELAIVELFTNKEKLLHAARAAESEVVQAFHAVLVLVTVVKASTISEEQRAAARQLCADIDPSDAPHVALTLALDGVLWTGDRRLKDGLRRKGFDRFFEPAEDRS